MLALVLKKLLVVYALLFCAIMITKWITAGDDAKAMSSPLSDAMVIKGKIAVKGNDPRAYLALTDENGVEYKLVGDHIREIRSSYQQQIISLKGKIQKKAVGTSMPAEFYIMDIIED